MMNNDLCKIKTLFVVNWIVGTNNKFATEQIRDTETGFIANMIQNTRPALVTGAIFP